MHAVNNDENDDGISPCASQDVYIVFLYLIWDSQESLL